MNWEDHVLEKLKWSLFGFMPRWHKHYWSNLRSQDWPLTSLRMSSQIFEMKKCTISFCYKRFREWETSSPATCNLVSMVLIVWIYVSLIIGDIIELSLFSSLWIMPLALLYLHTKKHLLGKGSSWRWKLDGHLLDWWCMCVRSGETSTQNNSMNIYVLLSCSVNILDPLLDNNMKSNLKSATYSW